MKDPLSSYYFNHDYNAHTDEKLLMLRAEHGAEGYGIFWMILESMAMALTGEINREAIGGLSLGYGIPKERLIAILDYCLRIELFEQGLHGAIYSTRMKAHLAKRKVLKDAGKRGAQKRWSQSQKNSHPNSKESKVKEKKGNKNNISLAADAATATEKKLPNHLMPLAVFTLVKGMTFDNTEQMQSHIKRYVRESKQLSGYAPDQILRAFFRAVDESQNRYDVQLETVGKKIAAYKDADIQPQYQEIFEDVLQTFTEKRDSIFTSFSPLLCQK